MAAKLKPGQAFNSRHLDWRPKKRQRRELDVSGDGIQSSPSKNCTRPISGKQKSSESNIGGLGSSHMQDHRQTLPISEGRQAIIRAIRENSVTILLGETGSGKTTQVPQYILDSGIAGNDMIAVTQPRRVAATSLAQRVATERDVVVGTVVGYSVRFDEKSSPRTRIKYLTDGMIIRELFSDNLLSQYSVIIVDEAHERTLRTDMLLSILKTVQQRRDGDDVGKSPRPLKIVIMSATLDVDKFRNFYPRATILYVKGRQHPVTIYHTAESQTDYLDAALRTFFQVHTNQPSGDVLIFLPGQDDIEGLAQSIQRYACRLPANCNAVTICQLYAALPPAQQMKVFSPPPRDTRKCILATNIAETSITIPGVKYVIDTGKCKEKRYLARDNAAGFDTLITKDISQSSAMQRAGRAGREGAGFCYRLYTEDAFGSMEISSEPEIRRCNLTSSLLELMCLGMNVDDLSFLDSPDSDAVVSALKALWLLGALDNQKSLTNMGRAVALFPLEPCYARAILAARDYGCVAEVLDIVSVLSASSKLFFDTAEHRESAAEARRKFRHQTGDHLTVLNAVKSHRESLQSQAKGKGDWCRAHFLNERTFLEASKICDQLRAICDRLHIDWKTSCGDNEEVLLKSFGHGLIQNTALLQSDGCYKQIMGSTVIKIHPSSALIDKKPPAIIYDELIYTSQIYARGVSIVPKSFVLSIGTMKRRSP